MSKEESQVGMEHREHRESSLGSADGTVVDNEGARQVKPEDSDFGSIPTFPKNLEHRVRRKLDWNIVPLILVLYMLSVLDRSNIGNARIAGMATDLDLSSDRYDWLLTIFYIPCICLCKEI
jgi:hypothetical protein